MEKEKWIDETLASLDGMRRAEAPPGLFEAAWQRAGGRTAKVVQLKSASVWAAAASIALLVVANVFTCLDFANPQPGNAQANRFATEFFAQAPSLYP